MDSPRVRSKRERKEGGKGTPIHTSQGTLNQAYDDLNVGSSVTLSQEYRYSRVEYDTFNIGDDPPLSQPSLGGGGIS